MYGVVLMAALTTGSASPDCHFHRYSYGCHGGCYGCTTCGGWGGHGFGCHGCYGGFGCHGCYGGGWGCYGGWGCDGCFGGYGCHASCGGCYGGCYGYIVAEGSPYHPTPTMPGVPAAPAAPAGKDGASKTSDRATLTVELPERAKLFVDDQPMKSTSAKRTFVTPPLEGGRTYYYELRAEVERDGQTMTVTRRVLVRPGQTVSTNFPEFQPDGTATARAGSR